MKTIFQAKINKLQLKDNVTTLLSSAFVFSSLLLVGCQTTPATISSTANNTPIAAKTTLAQAIQKQRRQSFSYHSNMQISNEQLSTVDGTQLVATNDVDSYCVDTHDQAYADLITQAEAIEKDVSDTAFKTQRSLIKQSYLDCNQAYEAWSAEQDYDDYESYGDYDDSAYTEEDALTDNDDYVNVVEPSYDVVTVEEISDTGSNIVETRRYKGQSTSQNSLINSSASNSESTEVSPYYQQLFDSLDDKTSTLDIKKAKLLEAYLLKPLSINAQGVYQPLAGRFTMLGSAQYQSRNNTSSINQPVYVDLKTGDIYLWADNFAMLNSELLDNKLGVKWQNKWLRLAIDDGTLPKGFGQALIKAHFNALDHAYEQADVSQFDFIAPSSLLTLSPKLPKQQLTPMMQSPQIIRRLQTSTSSEQMQMDYLRYFYEKISVQYPELIDNDIDVETASAIFAIGSLSSNNIVKKGLAMVNKIITADDDVVDIDNIDVGASTDDLEGYDSSDVSANKTESIAQQLYGFDNKGQLQWYHDRSQVAFDTSTDDTAKPQNTIDVLQQYLPLQRQDVIFPNLPSDMQIPNASNSIDLRAYSKELAEYYRAGNGTTMGKMLFNMLSMYNIQTPALDAEEAYELEEEAAQVVVETAE